MSPTDSTAPWTQPHASADAPSAPRVASVPPVSESYQWTSWPCTQHPKSTLLLIAVMLATGTAVWIRLGSILLATLSILALATSVAWFLLPTRVEINDSYVSFKRLRHKRQIPWSAIGAYRVDRLGIVLLPRSEVRPIDALQGICLPWGENRDRILALFEERFRAQQAGQPSSSACSEAVKKSRGADL